MVRNVLILLIVFCFFSSYGINKSQIVFKNIDNKQGLSQNGVLAIFQDREGYMWFGTHYGLNRFDGFEIKTFYKGDSKKDLAGNTIVSLVQDSIGNIWIATYEGISVFNPVTEQFFNLGKYESKEAIFSQTILSIKLIDSKILVSSNEGLWTINPVDTLFSDHIAVKVCGENFSHKLQCDINLQSPKIYNKDKDNTYWLTTNNHVIASKIVGNKLLVIDEIEVVDNANIDITTFYKDSFSNLWVGTDTQGLFKIAQNKGKFTSIKMYPADNKPDKFLRITDILQDNEKNLWISSRSNGVIIIPEADLNKNVTKPYKLDNDELKSQKIKSIFISRDNTFWLGSLGSGVFSYNSSGTKFKNYQITDESSNSSIRSISKDSFDRLWIGTLFEGLYIFDFEKELVVKSLLKNTSVLALSEIDDKHFFAGCSDGLYLISYTRENIKAEKISVNNEITGTVFSICNKKNRYWIGTGNKLICFELTDNYKTSWIESFNNELQLDTKSPNTIRCVKYDFINNCVWIGYEMSGLVKAVLDENNKIKEFISVNKLLKDSIILSPYICDIHFDDNNNCWVASRNGLAYLQFSAGALNSVNIYSVKNGFPSNMIQSVRSDKNGNLWIGTNKGLVRFNKLSNQIVRYDVNDGVQDNEFVEHSSYVDRNGTMYFGGINGVSEFSPDKLNINEFIEKVLIKDVIINGTSVKSLKELDGSNILKLAHFENNLKFDFISFNYINPLKCRYAYMLEGFDNDWIYTSADKRTAEYANLQKGNYTFKIKAINEDGVWSSDYTSLAIEIQPIFWVTFPAFIIYAILLATLIFVVSTITKRRVKRKHEQHLKKEHHDQLEKINLAKLQFFINISHEIRTPLTLIVCSVEKLITNFKLNNKQEKEVVTINRNVNRMLQLTNELLEIRKIETGNYQINVREDDIVQFIYNVIRAFESLAEKLNISLTVESYKPEVFLWFDANALEKVLYNFVSNAIKYTKSGGFVKIKISPSVKMNFLDINVTDNGIGISKEHLPKIFDRFYHFGGNKESYENGFGIGLSISKNLIELHKGTINVTSEPGKGSSFNISLPMSETAYSNDDKADKVIWKSDFSSGVESLENKKLIVDTTDITNFEIDNRDSTKPQILLVDDNEELLQNVSNYLSELYNVGTAPNGKIGFEMAVQNQPDVILSDILMPEMDGYEFCMKIKNNIITSHIPVILLTAKGDSESQYTSIDIGADYFIPKPFSIKLLSLRIKKIIESRDKLRRLFSTNQYSNIKDITTNSRDEQFMDKLLKYVNENIGEPDLNINFIADSMGMSRSTFFRKIKSITGTTGKEFVDSIRFKRATHLLLESDLNISEIAYDIGHSSPLYFSKWFKSHYKISPTEYISKHKKN